MRLQTVTPGVLTINAVIAFLQLQEVVMDASKIIKHIAKAHVLWMLAYLIFVGSQSFSSYQSLTPTQWVGRHVALRQRCVCLPTGRKRITFLAIIVKKKTKDGVSSPA